MTAGFFSPMPPARTGVADYSAALYAAMRAQGDIRLNQPAAARLYHIGNNALHGDIYRRALAEPGVVVLHDAVLHHFLLGALDEESYIEEFVYNYGPWNAGLAERLWRNRARSASAAIYFDHPLLRRIVETSRAVIVHNPAAARIAARHAPAARIHVIPHLFIEGPQPAAYEVVRLRASLGLRPSDTLFGVFGHLRESKRLAAILEAFRRLRDPRAALLIAGEFVSSDLARAMSQQLTGPHIHRVGYTPERTFWRYAHAVDVCLNLRYPTAGETSGIAVRLMGIGKPVLVTAGDETAAIPEAAAVRVDPGLAEIDMLSDLMRWLSRFPSDRHAIGARAQHHIARCHAASTVAAEFWRILAESHA